MWREEVGFFEMLMAYMSDYVAFEDWGSWRTVLEDILSCHEAVRRQRIESSLRREGVGEEEKATLESSVDPERLAPTISQEENCLWEEGVEVKEEEEEIARLSCVGMRGENAGSSTSDLLVMNGFQNEYLNERKNSSVMDGTSFYRHPDICTFNPPVVEKAQNTISRGFAVEVFSGNDARRCEAFPGSSQKNGRKRFRSEEDDIPRDACSSKGYSKRVEKTGKEYQITIKSERPKEMSTFSCRYCTKTFAALGTKINHERTHTGERPYACSFCSWSFAQLSTKNKHEQRAHAKDSSRVDVGIS